MAPTLGKRKRISRKELARASLSPSPCSCDSGRASASGENDVLAIFRRAFEARFAPLPEEPKQTKPDMDCGTELEQGTEEEVSDWAGISDDDHQVQVVDYADRRLGTDKAPDTKAEMKAFMTSKPPASGAAPKTSIPRKPSPADAELTDAANLKNDLDLQKLLRESHLLSASKSGTCPASLSATGSARHKSTDLHLQSLGAKASIFTQKKMPMAQRKHMVQKARLRDAKRRADAREAGVILERPATNRMSGKREPQRNRDRAVGLPGVGKFRGGTLSLSKRDVQSITGGGGSGPKSKGKGTRARH
ncbi:pre-rRNA processing and 40S ribosomal subunit assembly [Pleosporales sp. CAS-2024a]